MKLHDYGTWILRGNTIIARENCHILDLPIPPCGIPQDIAIRIDGSTYLLNANLWAYGLLYVPMPKDFPPPIQGISWSWSSSDAPGVWKGLF